MNITRALTIRDKGQSVLIDLYSSAKIFGLDSATMNTRRLAQLDRAGVNKAPHWVSSYLDGYWRAVMDSCYRADLVFGAIIDGQFYSTHRDRADYYEKHGIEPLAFGADSNPTSGHYWRESLKPFYVMQPR